MEHLVSIIVPVYKVENVVQRCIKSITAQTYTNIEIIIVDDGSPDGSGAICDSLAQDNSRIKVFHLKNGGVSYARNFGIQNAAGDLLAFVDADDLIMPTYIATLVEMTEKYNADISCCAFRRIFNDADITVYTSNAQTGEKCLSGRDACFELFGSRFTQMVSACCKLIKKPLVLDNMFPVRRIHNQKGYSYAKNRL